MDEVLSVRLASKVESLIAKYEELKSENVNLRKELDLCRTQLDYKTNKIAELEKKIGNLQLKEAFSDSRGVSAGARKKVADLIKEIDECIGMLSV